MTRRDFKTKETPIISIVECIGDLRVRSWDKPTVQIRTDDDLVETQQEGDTIMVKSKGDTRVLAPASAILNIQQANGSARIAHIKGEIHIHNVIGDLVLSHVGNTIVEEANSDLSARVIHGDLTVNSVIGDMSARGVSGRLEVHNISRDLGLRDLEGEASADDVLGDIRLRTGFSPGKTYTFKARGDIIARVPADTSANFTLRSKRVKVRGTELEDELRTDDGVTGRLGDGSAEVVLEAGRDVILIVQQTDEPPGWSDIGVGIGIEFGTEFAGLAEEIDSKIESHMDVMNIQLERKLADLETGLASIDVRAAKAARRFQTQAERAAEKLRRTAAKEAEKARRRARKHSRRRPTRPLSPKPPVPPSDPVSDNERLAILNMVAEGKITIEEAEKLLLALQGR